VPQSAVAANVHQSFDIHGDLTSEVTFHAHFLVDNVAQAIDLVVGQFAHPRIWIDIRALEELLARMESYSVDIWQCRLDALIARKIDSRYSRHVVSPLLRSLMRKRLSLPLLVPRIHANHANDPVSPNDLAFFATASDGCRYFHLPVLFCFHT
jgi:hypothetical protein